jgi:hypothetical protein
MITLPVVACFVAFMAAWIWSMAIPGRKGNENAQTGTDTNRTAIGGT